MKKLYSVFFIAVISISASAQLVYIKMWQEFFTVAAPAAPMLMEALRSL